MATPQGIAARNELGGLLDNLPERAAKMVVRIESLAAEIGTLQTAIQADPDSIYEPGDIGLLNQVRADIKAALQQAAAAI